MNRMHGDQEGEQNDGMGPMGHGSGRKGMALMVLCCVPMIAIVILVVVGVLR